jgi:hypothetical protein
LYSKHRHKHPLVLMVIILSYNPIIYSRFGEYSIAGSRSPI